MASSLRPRKSVNYKVMHEGDLLEREKPLKKPRTIVLLQEYFIERIIWRKTGDRQSKHPYDQKSGIKFDISIQGTKQFVYGHRGQLSTGAIQVAPYTALQGVIVDGRIPLRHPVTSRCRVRKQVGQTNRWRLPESLGSDLLGSSQAVKAVTMPYNQTLVNIITAESAHMNMNLDVSQPYRFRQTADRPFTEPALATQDPFSKWERTSATTSAVKLEVPASAPIISRGPRTLGPIKKFVPPNARPVTPKELFLYHSKRSKSNIGPEHIDLSLGHDVLLRCLGMDWELHRPFLQKSETLTNLLKGADDPTPQLYYKSSASETLDNYIKKSNFYSNEYREMSNRLSTVEGVDEPDKKLKEVKQVDHPAHSSEKRVNNVTVIHMDIHDPAITKTALAIALGNMYHDDIDVDVEQLAGVLAAASLLQFKALIKGCVNLMLKNINSRTVCKYHEVASRHQQEHVVLACERWLELNLIPDLSNQIQLRQVPMDLLQKILKSNRLFVFNEHSVYKLLSYWLFMQLNPHLQLMPSHSTVLSYFNRHVGLLSYWLYMQLNPHLHLMPSHSTVLSYFNRNVGLLSCWLFMQLNPHLQLMLLHSTMLSYFNRNVGLLSYWLFMQLNPHLQLMPSHSTVLSYFNNLPKTTSFIERDDGQIYDPLFSAVRLHGILDTGNIQDMQLMNVLPRDKLIDLLSQHYHALQGGGDMSVMKNFNSGAIRQGFIIDDDPLYHSEVMSLHGFHFELKAVGSKDGGYSVFMQRLKPGDPILSFRQCERHTFSMRADREVRYCITVQYVDGKGENQIHTTGIQAHKFGIGEKTSKSEMIQLTKMKKPLFVQFSVLFPSS